MKVLVVEPEKKPYVKDIESGLYSLQHEVNFTDLSEDLVAEFSKRFETPEQFILIDGDIIALPYYLE